MSWPGFPIPSKFVMFTTVERNEIISHVERAFGAQPEEVPLTLATLTERSINSLLEWIKLMPTRISIDIQGTKWTADPEPTYLPPGTNVQFINEVAGKDLMLHFTTGAECLSDPEFVIPCQGSRVISVSPGCKGVVVDAYLWMRDAGQTEADWKKVASEGTGNGAGMQIDNP